MDVENDFEVRFMTLADINNSINQKLKQQFGLKVYGREVEDGFDRPCFFAELIPSGSDSETQNFTSNRVIVHITYFQTIDPAKNYSNLENIKMYDSLNSLFGLTLPVGDRRLHPQNVNAEFVGDQKDILQFGFTLDYFDGTGYQRDTEPVMQNITLDLKEGG